MASSIINATINGINATGGNTAELELQVGGTTAITVNSAGYWVLANALPAVSGGTGINSVGTSGNVLTSNGTAWESVAPPASNNASALTIGTVAVNVGGTGATTLNAEAVVIGNGTSSVKFVDPGTTGNVLTSNGTAWTSAAAAAGGGDYVMQVYTSPATWTKPASVKAVKVTVLGGGGGGGGSRAPSPGYAETAAGGAAGGGSTEYLDASAIPGPVAVTVGSGGAGAPAPGSGGTSTGSTGGTSSFGAFLSATGGAGSSATVGAGGTGSGGQINITGCSAGFGVRTSTPSLNSEGGGGSFMFAAGFGRSGTPSPPTGGNSGEAATANTGCGGGGSTSSASPTPRSGGAGGSGLVIVEEFY
jgi:hypothetical protein